jgi:general secretion pathway protein A
VPRVINIICDRALLGAYSMDRHRVTSNLVRNAAAEVFGRRFTPYWMPWAASGATAVVLLLAVIALVEFQPWKSASTSSSDSTAHVAASVVPTASSPAKPATPAVTPATPTPVITATPAPTPAATANMRELLVKHAGETDTDSAFGALFGLWGMQYVRGGVDPCSQASKQGLDCLVQRGSFGQLRLYNRPAILMLSDDSGGSHQVVLKGLDDEQAHLQLGGASMDVGIADLSRYWLGDFVMLWRPGTAQQVKALSQGMRGDDVRWLRESLQRVQGARPGAPHSDTPVSDVFDADLSKLVKDFQRDHRLAVDGIAGVQTQIVLATAIASPDTPLLYVANTHGS